MKFRQINKQGVDYFVSICIEVCLLSIVAKIMFLRSWQILFLTLKFSSSCWGWERPVQHRNALRRFLCCWVCGRAKVKERGENSFANTSISCRQQLHTGLWTLVSYPQAFELWAQCSVCVTFLYFQDIW